MKTIINTLFHGDKLTKLLLWSCVAAVLAGIAFIAVFFISGLFPWVIAAIIAFLTPLIIIRNYDFLDKMGAAGTVQPQNEKSEKIKEKTSIEKTEEKKYEAVPEVLKETKEKPGKIQKEKRKETEISSETDKEVQKGLQKTAEETGEAEHQGHQAQAEGTEEEIQDLQLSEVHQQVREETDEGLPEEDEGSGKGQKKGKEKSREGAERELEEEPEAKAEKPPVDNKRALKKLLFKYKVKREHKPVIIDSSIRWRVEKCPAYMWIAKGQAHFLLMEENPREIVVNAGHASISYCVEQAEPSEEYLSLRNNALFMQLFGDCLPQYHDEVVNRRRVYTKNLYLVDDDIKLTNSSARAAFDLMKASFDLPDRYNLPETTGTYTREAHKSKILWQDGVISTNEFKIRSKNLLQEMTDSNISGREFDKNLFEMVSRQLITKEYAEYYSGLKRDETAKKDKQIKISNF